MNVEELRQYCLSKKGTEEGFPFDEHTLVFKVLGKIFAITSLNWEACQVNLKCDPEYAIELRENHHAIQPGYHMNKKHWNTVNCEELFDDQLLRSLIDHSYNLVVNKLSKHSKTQLETL